jgi:CsoR family transcriptional regulator, copper-sensing transcriptional repressor
MSFKPKNNHERVQHRLKIVRGHLEKVIKMVEEDAYCIDVIHQSQAVQNALKEVDDLVLENHLVHCAADAIKKGNSKEAITEVMNVFRRKN